MNPLRALLGLLLTLALLGVGQQIHAEQSQAPNEGGEVIVTENEHPSATFEPPVRPKMSHYLDAFSPSPFQGEVVVAPQVVKVAPAFTANLVLKGYHTIGGKQTVVYQNTKSGQT